MYKRQATETTIRENADLKPAQIFPRETEFSEKKHGPKQEICFLLFYLRQISMFEPIIVLLLSKYISFWVKNQVIFHPVIIK